MLSTWKGLQKSFSHGAGKKRRVLVCFVGGITYAEIAAMRFLQSQAGTDADLLFATTEFVNGTTLLQSFQDEVSLLASARSVLTQ